MEIEETPFNITHEHQSLIENLIWFGESKGCRALIEWKLDQIGHDFTAVASMEAYSIAYPALFIETLEHDFSHEQLHITAPSLGDPVI